MWGVPNRSDERILGDGNFVDQVLSVAEEQMEQRNLLISQGYNLKMTAERVCSGKDGGRIKLLNLNNEM